MSDDLLICGPNWLGDCIMSMPAVQALRRRRPRAGIVMVSKERVLALWRMHAAVDRVIELKAGAPGLLRAAREVREGRVGSAVLFPNSLRSALVPFLAGVPERRGSRGHMRRWLLTRVTDTTPVAGREHQLWEYMLLAGCDGEHDAEEPRLTVPDSALARAHARIRDAGDRALVAVIPGAARGPSKQWPARHFAEAGRRLVSATGCRILVLGTRAETELCGRVAAAVGPAAENLAGETGIEDLAAVLSLCRVALTNDSGGMHLATAVGTRVVSVFGRTDPRRTGPIGSGHSVIGPEDAGHRSRDIPRTSREAAAALDSIAPGRVFAAACRVLDASR